jgi:hypothetical protein
MPRLTDEGSATTGLHVGGNGGTFTKDRGEIIIGDIIHLFDARSAKVGAIDGTTIDGGSNLKEFVKRQGTGRALDIGEGLGNAELIVVRSTENPIKYSTIRLPTKAYSARQTAFLTVG